MSKFNPKFNEIPGEFLVIPRGPTGQYLRPLHTDAQTPVEAAQEILEPSDQLAGLIDEAYEPGAGITVLSLRTGEQTHYTPKRIEHWTV